MNGKVGIGNCFGSYMKGEVYKVVIEVKRFVVNIYIFFVFNIMLILENWKKKWVSNES